jgi:hypothetical protein
MTVTGIYFLLKMAVPLRIALAANIDPAGGLALKLW